MPVAPAFQNFLERLRGIVTPQRYAALVAFLLPMFAALLPRGIAALTITGGVFGALLVRRDYWRWQLPRSPVVRLSASFLLICTASVLWSVDPANSLLQAVELIYTAIPAAVLVWLLSGEDPQTVRHIPTALLVGYGAGTVIVAIDVTAGTPFYHLMRGRLETGGIELLELNRNMVAMACLLWPAAMLITRRFGVVWVYALTAGWLIIILSGNSQSAAIGLIAGVATFAAARRAPIATYWSVTALILVVFVGAIPLSILLYQTGLAGSDLLAFSMRHRIEVWDFAARTALEKPLIGWGIDASRVMGGQEVPTEHLPLVMSKLPVHPHSAYLQVWLELGAVGCAVALALCLTLLGRIRRTVADADRPAALAGLVCVSASAGVSYGIWQAWWISTIILSLTLLYGLARPAQFRP